MSRSSDITIRAALPSDKEAIDRLAALENMDVIPSTAGVLVAQSDADGSIVGFVRTVLGTNAVWHVNPIIVDGSWRGSGVGRALMEYVLNLYGEIRLQSRGSSRAFYEHLGFENCALDDLDPEVAHDCEGCPDIVACKPQPMFKKTV